MACIESMNEPGLPQVDRIIKWNPRSTDAVQMAAELDAAGTAWEQPRAGSRVATWEQAVSVPGVQRTVRHVLRLIELAEANRHDLRVQGRFLEARYGEWR